MSNGPKLTFDQFEKIFNEIKNWSDFPADKLERGSLNYITSETVKSAAAEVKNGRVVRMALPWNTTSAIDNPSPALHYIRREIRPRARPLSGQRHTRTDPGLSAREVWPARSHPGTDFGRPDPRLCLARIRHGNHAPVRVPDRARSHLFREPHPA